MREILFRGKRLDNGEWVEGYLAGYGLICCGEPKDTLNATGEYCGETPYVGFIEVDPATIGQYTGLKDKNGKRIFEGDIVRYYELKYGGGNVPVCQPVGYEEGGFCTHRYFLNNWLRNSVNGNIQLEEIEVIGKIHDKSEHLEAHDE